MPFSARVSVGVSWSSRAILFDRKPPAENFGASSRISIGIGWDTLEMIVILVEVCAWGVMEINVSGQVRDPLCRCKMRNYLTKIPLALGLSAKYSRSLERLDIQIICNPHVSRRVRCV